MTVDIRGLFIMAIISLFISSAIVDGGETKEVSYDGRSLIINGKRELLFSGSIHYPRSTPEVMNIQVFMHFLILGSGILIKKT